MGKNRGRQLHLSKEHQILRDVKSRRQKFKKILSVLQDYHPNPQFLNCLDIGCSSGIITTLLGEHCPMVIGMDIDRGALYDAKEHSPPWVQFFIADAMALPFKENSIHVIVCNHIYEHVPQAEGLMDEIYRVLSAEGFCYFSAGNKYVVIEGHYHLPFLSWIPKPLAHLYLRLAGKGDFYYEEHLSLRGLKRLVRRFRVHDYTLSIIRHPEKFHATDLFGRKTFLRKCMVWFAPCFYRWFPTYIWVLTKK